MKQYKQFKHNLKARAEQRKGPDRQGAWGSDRKSGSAPTKSHKYPQKQKDLMEITDMNLVDLIMIALNITSIILLVLVVKEYRKLKKEIE
nr:MAG TPA: hypothetical protein [Bacteriophage sp.]